MRLIAHFWLNSKKVEGAGGRQTDRGLCGSWEAGARWTALHFLLGTNQHMHHYREDQMDAELFPRVDDGNFTLCATYCSKEC
jgi:hypothetical protein